MNKKNNRKGFTIVELVIVIAVIAILATVLIPTFGNIIEKANKSAALQEAKATFTNYVAEVAETGEYNDNVVISAGEYFFAVVGGELQPDAYDSAEDAAEVFDDDVEYVTLPVAEEGGEGN